MVFPRVWQIKDPLDWLACEKMLLGMPRSRPERNGSVGLARPREFGPVDHRAIPWVPIDYGCCLPALDFVVRPCRTNEASAVLELWEQTRSEHATMPDRPDDVRRLLSHDAGSLLVADVDGAILGALIAGSDGWRGNMYRLAVRAEHRRMGIGLALVRAGEQHLRKRGANRVTVLVAYEDDIAVSFWEAAGYPQDHEIGRHVRNL